MHHPCPVVRTGGLLDGAAASSSSVGLLVSYGLVGGGFDEGEGEDVQRLCCVEAQELRETVEQRSGSKRYEQTWTRDDGLMGGDDGAMMG